MPFDGVPPITEAAQVIDTLVEFFDAGKRWCKHRSYRDEKRCLSYALSMLHKQHRLDALIAAQDYILKVIHKRKFGSIVQFNDAPETKWKTVLDVLFSARELAMKLEPELKLDLMRHLPPLPKSKKDRRIHDGRQLEFLAFA
jgi:hypothetical protein